MVGSAPVLSWPGGGWINEKPCKIGAIKDCERRINRSLGANFPW